MYYHFFNTCWTMYSCLILFFYCFLLYFLLELNSIKHRISIFLSLSTWILCWLWSYLLMVMNANFGENRMCFFLLFRDVVVDWFNMYSLSSLMNQKLKLRFNVNNILGLVQTNIFYLKIDVLFFIHWIGILCYMKKNMTNKHIQTR